MSWINTHKNTLIALGVFLLVAFIYFSPLYSGMKMLKHDSLSWEYMSHTAKEYAENSGELTYWTNSMFGGMPTYTFYGNAKSNFLMQIYFFVIDHIFLVPMVYFLISMILMYVLLSLSRLNLWSKITLSILGTFVSYSTIITAAGHDGKMLTIALFPGILAGVLMVYGGKLWKGIITLVITLVIALSMGMQQVEYYMAFVFAFLGIYEFIKSYRKKNIKDWLIRTGIILGIFLVSVLSAMTNFTPLLEYNEYTMRGGNSELTLNKDEKDADKSDGLNKDYAFSWSNSWGESLTSIIPMLYGGASAEKLPENSNLEETLYSIGVPAQYVSQFTERAPTYWGKQPFVSGPIYFGALVMFLFVLAIAYYKHPSKWWILASILITFFISLGDNFKAFNYFMFDNFPLFNNFRSPTMVLSLTYVLIVYLASISLFHFVTDLVDKKKKLKSLYIAVGVIGGIIVLFGLMGSSFFDFTSPNDQALKSQYMQMFQDEAKVNQVLDALRQDRISIATSSAWRSLIFLLLGAGLLWAWLNDYFKFKYLIPAIALIAIIDNMGIANKYLNKDNYIPEEEYETNFYPRKVDTDILKDTDPFYRVLDVSVNTFNDAKPSYFHNTVGGYSPAKLESYQDLIDMHLGGQQSAGKFNSEVLNMLNTKYLVYGQPNQEQLLNRAQANGNAWFVNNIKWAKSADEEMLAMKAPAEGDTVQVANPFDSKNEVVLREGGENDLLKNYTFGKDSTSKIRLTEYGLPHLKFVSSNAQDGLAVFSDIYYPAGWNAYIDGQKTPIFRANYLLRAIQVPKGDHEVEFRFEPKTLLNAIKISLLGTILATLLLFWSIYQSVRRKENIDMIADDV